MQHQFIKAVLLFSVIHFVCSQVDNSINSVTNVDLMTAMNSKNHFTTMFYRTAIPPQLLIIRRGGTFNIRIHLKSPFFQIDRIQLHFKFETKLGVYNVRIPSGRAHNWGSKFNVKSNVIEAQITLPIDVPVGFWDLYIYTYKGDNRQRTNTYLVRDILILFNPYSPADSVFMQNAVDLQEYLLNEYGFIATIDTKVLSRRPWIYGQFKTSTIQALKIVLSKIWLKPSERADPVKVSRALSAIVNFQNDLGMMAGRWNGTYEIDLYGYKTRHPLLWLGSPEVFEEYIRNNGNVIGFAQCWVFASVITTFGRALGIPSRTVTNLESGHDYDANATISFKFNANSEVDSPYSESIWNFHVWTEMWMKRYDLSSDGLTYGGWQILDGTPQQVSKDTIEVDKTHWFQLGPTSRVAVKRADVLLKYDTKFVYAEVNADLIFRNYLKEVILMSPDRIGKGTYAKGPGDNLIDVTLAYKEKEGTVMERSSFSKAIQLIYNLPTYHARSYKSWLRDFKVKMGNRDQRKLGSVIDFYVTVSNDFPKARLFDVYVHAYSLYYNGFKGHTIYNLKYQLNLNAFSENEKIILLNPEQYIYKLVPFSIIRIEIAIKTPQRKLFAQMFDITLQKPQLIINPFGTAVIGKPFYVDVKLVNPLNVPLTNCMIAIHGLRLDGNLHRVSSVAANEAKLYRFALVFNEAINEVIAIQFSATELDQVIGHINVPIRAY